jgi:hypothetical protein
MPWSSWAVAGALPSATVAGGVQLHPRVPNGLGSALTRAAVPAAAQTTIAVPHKAFLITVTILRVADRTPRC